jgi:hypothetical protein
LYPKANKEHKCIWCGEGILKGEVHYQFKGKWEGEWQNWRMHKECIDAANKTDELREGILECGHKRGLAEEY